MASFIQVKAFPHYLNERTIGEGDERSGHSLSDGRFLENEPHRFTRLVAVLEAQASSRLKSPARELCLAAYQSAPEGFEVPVKRARDKARSNPVGLLIRMVQEGKHLIVAPTDLWQESATPRSND
jgi:hypothetical protein